MAQHVPQVCNGDGVGHAGALLEEEHGPISLRIIVPDETEKSLNYPSVNAADGVMGSM